MQEGKAGPDDCPLEQESRAIAGRTALYVALRGRNYYFTNLIAYGGALYFASYGTPHTSCPGIFVAA